MKKTINKCQCGEIAKVKKPNTGEWLCYRCAVRDILKQIAEGQSVTMCVSDGPSLSDVILVPDYDGQPHALAYLHEVLPIATWGN